MAEYNVTAAASLVAGACASAGNNIQAWDTWENLIGDDSSTVELSSTGTSIGFYTNSGCGTPLPSNQTTLSSGEAAFYFSSTVKQGNFTITATRVGNSETGTSGNVYVDPAAASALLVKLPGESFVDGTGITGSASFTGTRSPNATAGTSFSVDIKAVDQYNNLVDSGPNNYDGSKTISWGDSVAGNAPDTTSPSFPGSPITFTNGILNKFT